MKLSKTELTSLLIKNNVATAEKLDELTKIADQGKQSLLEVMYQKKLLTERDFTKMYADETNSKFVDLTGVSIPKEVIEKLPQRVSQRYQAVVFGEDEGHLKVALADTGDVEAVQSVQKQCGYDCEIFLATPSDINLAIEQYKEGLSTEISKAIKETEEEISIEKEELDENASAEGVEAIISEAPIARAVNILIEYAVKSRASDIHIEPREDFVQVRYRVDGILRDTMTLPKALMSSVISRIKILANLRIDEHRIPQDGRIKLKIGGQNISIRVSTLPVIDGEKIVMRLLDESSRALTLEELGYKGQALIAIERALKKPHGMLLVTGPTGSGKSTTLYSVLSSLNTIGVNISTVEDPVEYRIQGINQTQVNTQVGMTFSSGLRALLRQDPDIIMVGEIRDSETAEMAVHAALTGHIVLSTLHTNNAAGCLPRLLDMEIEPFLIASTVNAVIGQRLVRRLCPHCVESYQPDEKVIAEIIENFGLRKEFLTGTKHAGLLPTAAVSVEAVKSEEKEKPAGMSGEKKIPVPSDLVTDRKSILEQIKDDPDMVNRSAKEADEITLRNNIFLSEKERVEAEKKNGFEFKPGTLNLTLYRSKGCNKCDNSGYLGRMGIYEVLEVDEEIGKLIVGHATTEDLQNVAITNGMITMQQDGFLKCLEGITTVEEVLRVTRE
jgi:type IV pilus assembly protein PilB